MSSLPFDLVPIRERIEMVPELTGRGVTIGFLDSGFSNHPDLRNRILAFHDATDEGGTLNDAPGGYQWHGTMTSVIGAGNGHLSGGVYASLAPDANVVLVKTATADSSIAEEHMVSGMQWMLDHQEEYNIRVVNISVGAGSNVPAEMDELDRMAELAVRAGMVVVAAAGNLGSNDEHWTIPPANSPSVLTVGGCNDNGSRMTSFVEADMYWSTSYGETPDGVVKPEVVALAEYLPAPVLPHTVEYRRGEILFHLEHASPERLRQLVRQRWRLADLPEWLADQSDDDIRAYLQPLIEQDKIVSPHYKQVQGTSFSSALVSAMVAQLLEANPSLTPALVKHVLISSAERLTCSSWEHQGYGRIHMPRAVALARQGLSSGSDADLRPPRVVRGRLIFHYLDPTASSVAVAGDFTDWRAISMEPGGDGEWRLDLDLPPGGEYGYKYVVDGERWVADPSNGHQRDDGMGGSNSVLTVS